MKYSDDPYNSPDLSVTHGWLHISDADRAHYIPTRCITQIYDAADNSIYITTLSTMGPTIECVFATKDLAAECADNLMHALQHEATA